MGDHLAAVARVASTGTSRSAAMLEIATGAATLN
jgi:hypothetical protein